MLSKLKSTVLGQFTTTDIVDELKTRTERNHSTDREDQSGVVFRHGIVSDPPDDQSSKDNRTNRAGPGKYGRNFYQLETGDTLVSKKAYWDDWWAWTLSGLHRNPKMDAGIIKRGNELLDAGYFRAAQRHGFCGSVPEHNFHWQALSSLGQSEMEKHDLSSDATGSDVSRVLRSEKGKSFCESFGLNLFNEQMA